MRVRFGKFVFDSGRHELCCQGAEIRLAPKAFQLLEILIRRAPNAVSQEEIYEALWPRTVVNPANLHNLVSQIRVALGPECRSAIRTIYGYGFSFDRNIDVEESGKNRSLYWLIVQPGSSAMAHHPLKEGKNVIGREERAEITLPLPSISNPHAVVTVHDTIAVIEDLGSERGTYVEGKRIDGVAALTDGTTIRLGEIIARFLRLDPSETTFTPMA